MTASTTRAGERPPDPLLQRNLRLFHAFRFLSTSYLFIPVMVLFFHDRGLDYTRIALLNTVYAITAIVFEVPTGALADRFGRRRAMVLGALLMAAGCLVDFGGRGFWSFALGEGLLALGMTLSSGADSAYLYDLLRSAGREHEYRRYEGSATAAKLLGAAAALAVGGWLARWSMAVTYAASAGVCLAAAVVALLLRERNDRAVAEPRFFRGMARAASIVTRSTNLRFAVGFSVIVFTLLRMSLYVQTPWLAEAGFDVTTLGAVLALLSLVGALSSARFDWFRRRIGEAPLVVVLPLVMGVSYGLLGRFTASWGVGLFLLQAICNGIYSPFSKELLNRQIDSSGHRATILSVESMARRLAFGALAPTVGWLMDHEGLASGLYACGLFGGVGAFSLLALYARRLRSGFHGFAGEMTPTPVPHPSPMPCAEAVPTPTTASPSERLRVIAGGRK